MGRGHLTDHDNFGEPQPPRVMAVSEGGLVFFLGVEGFSATVCGGRDSDGMRVFLFMFGGIWDFRCEIAKDI